MLSGKTNDVLSGKTNDVLSGKTHGVSGKNKMYVWQGKTKCMCGRGMFTFVLLPFLVQCSFQHINVTFRTVKQPQLQRQLLLQPAPLVPFSAEDRLQRIAVVPQLCLSLKQT